MTIVDIREAPLAAGSASPIARCERVLSLLRSDRGDPLTEVDRLLVDDPTCGFGHCLRAALLVLADSRSARAALRASIAAIDGAGYGLSAHARRHGAAALAWLAGDTPRALALYGAIVIDHPRDFLALKVAHALDFRLGRRRLLRDRLAQVLPEWDPTVPGFASVLAMYAFGLVENGQYRSAEVVARRALALDPGHPGAIHVLAHVMEMRGHASEGVAWLTATESSWGAGTGYSVHLAWHRALFHLELDMPEAALAEYDARIVAGRSPSVSALVDASALLWRLLLRGLEVSDRWRELADRWETQPLVGARAFTLVHALLAFAVARRDDAARLVRDALHEAVAHAADIGAGDAILARPLCDALLAFTQGDYPICVERLGRVRHLAHRCGGSLAQCDLVHLTLIEAAFRARQTRLARALARERPALRAASRLSRVLVARAESALRRAHAVSSGPRPVYQTLVGASV